jgi:pimeloyl-ACP methyl ester carboxylesterase
MVVALAALGGVIVISHVVEALRRAPRPPKTLRWGPEISVDYRTLIPGAHVTTVPGSGHFLPLDRPQELRNLILSFAGT